MFWKKHKWACVFILFLIVSECTYMPFWPFNLPWLEYKNRTYTLGSMLYHLNNQVGYVSLLPAILLFKSSKGTTLKGLYLGVIAWNCFETLQDLSYVLKIEIGFLEKSENHKVTIAQIVFIVLIFTLSYHGFKKWRL